MKNKKKKKKYNNTRSLRLVCLEHRQRWATRTCGCEDSSAWILVSDNEFPKFTKTGLVPNWKAEINWVEGEKKPAWVSPGKAFDYSFIQAKNISL